MAKRNRNIFYGSKNSPGQLSESIDPDGGNLHALALLQAQATTPRFLGSGRTAWLAIKRWLCSLFTGCRHEAVKRTQPHSIQAAALISMGSVNWKVAPRPELALAHKRPPCDSMIDRLIESPIPVPSGFVVKNASKILLAWSEGSPAPLSLTEISS